MLTEHERKCNKVLGENLKRLRLSLGLGVNDLSRISEVNASYISAIENGKKNNPSRNVLEKLAQALNVSVEVLLIEKMIPDNEKNIDVSEEGLKVLFNKIRNLSESDQRKIKAVIDAFEKESQE